LLITLGVRLTSVCDFRKPFVHSLIIPRGVATILNVVFNIHPTVNGFGIRRDPLASHIGAVLIVEMLVVNAAKKLLALAYCRLQPLEARS
jgi:hypothetical protein